MGDIRVLKTKENLVNSFFELLNSEKYEDITVSQLCQYARCSRSTFYSYYNSKENFFYEIVDIYIQKVNFYAKERFNSHIDFEFLLMDMIKNLIMPEKKRFYKLFKINMNDNGLPVQLEKFFKKLFIKNNPKNSSTEIVSELYAACVVKILKVIIEDRLKPNDIHLINNLQNNLFGEVKFCKQ